MMFLLQVFDGFPAVLFDFTLRSFVLGILAGFLVLVMGRRNPALQYAALRLALIAMLLLPLATLVMPSVSLPIHWTQNRHSVSLPSHPALAVQLPSSIARSRPPAAGSSHDFRPSIGQHVDWYTVAVLLYLLVTGFLISRIFVGMYLMRRIAGTLSRLDHPQLLERVNHQCFRLGVLTFPEFRSGANVTVPITFGWRNPVIVLPADWPSWPAEKLDLVIAHELSHVQRSDYLIRVIANINKALYWFHPLSWWLEKRLTELSEHLSDDAALGEDAVPRERYAEILGDFANALDRSGSPFRLGISMSVSALGSRRIKRVLDRNRTLCSNLNLPQKLGLFGLSIPVLVLIAGAQTADRPQTQTAAQTDMRGPVAQISPSTSQGRHQPRIAPPMFSPTYVNALQGILDIEPQDAVELETRLKEDPEDFTSRLKLIAYSMRADRAALPEARNQKAELVRWLIAHHPDSEILGSPYTLFSGEDLISGQLPSAKTLWEEATRAWPTDAHVMWNAANFYGQDDRQIRLDLLEKAVALAPDSERYAQALGLLYAGAILTVDPLSLYRDAGGPDVELARHAAEVLDTTQNPFLLQSAVKLLQGDYNRSLMMAKPDSGLGQLASRYFQRAKALDPDLDEAWIFQKIDSKMVGIFAPGARPPDDGASQFEAAEREIRRVSPDVFLNLPPAIRTALRSRGCLVPQQTFTNDAGAQPHNVIKGEFFEKGRAAWAVLCSVRESSSILVFRDASDQQPDELAAEEDKNQLQGADKERIAYSREIQPVGRKYIVDRARGNGEPEPPPIDHQGINDEFVGKASTVYYWYRGKWLTLSGDD